MADQQVEVKNLLDAGVHFGHLTRKWNPNMAPYIYMERNGIHVINLYKTIAKLEESQEALRKIAASGRKILFVATKKQAKDIVAQKVSEVNMPYITERWPGGMLTNFVTIRKAVKKMTAIDRMKKDGTFNTLSKKERLQVDRLRAKLEKNLGSIADMTRLPGAIFIVDTIREHIAVKEAQKLNIPIFAMADTNSDPRAIDYIIPANDDAGKSIEIIISEVTRAVAEGLAERKTDKGETGDEAETETVAEAEETSTAAEPTVEEVVTEAASEPETPAVEAAQEDEAPAEAEATAEEEVAATEVAAEEAETVAEGMKESIVEEPAKEAPAKPDDLTKIEGIGPKAAEALVGAGIATYSGLAESTPEAIKDVLTAASSTLAHLEPGSWPKQAAMAAAGQWEELKVWQDNAKGGVE